MLSIVHNKCMLEHKSRIWGGHFVPLFSCLNIPQGAHYDVTLHVDLETYRNQCVNTENNVSQESKNEKEGKL